MASTSDGLSRLAFRQENEAKRGEATWVPERLRFLIGEASGSGPVVLRG